jgi:hypothetical protein
MNDTQSASFAQASYSVWQAVGAVSAKHESHVTTGFVGSGPLHELAHSVGHAVLQMQPW